MRHQKCYLFVPWGFVGLENLIPFLVTLKSEGWNPCVIVIEKFMRSAIRAAPDYEKILNEN